MKPWFCLGCVDFPTSQQPSRSSSESFLSANEFICSDKEGNYFIEEENFSEVYFVVEFISKLLPQGLLGLAGFSFSLAWVLITVQAREAQKKAMGRGRYSCNLVAFVGYFHSHSLSLYNVDITVTQKLWVVKVKSLHFCTPVFVMITFFPEMAEHGWGAFM